MPEITLGSLRSAPGEIWLGSPGYPVDVSGTRDNSAVLRQALVDASNLDYAVRAPMGIIGLGSSVQIYDNTKLYGVQGTTTSNFGEPQGTIFKPLASFSTASCPVYNINILNVNTPPGIFFIDGSASTPNEIALLDFWVDGSSLSTATQIDGIIGLGAVQALIMERVGVIHAPGHGISAYTLSISSVVHTPDGWHFTRAHADSNWMDGFHGTFVDCVAIGVHSQSNGQSGTGDGLFNNGTNARWIGCRFDLNQNGVTVDAFPGGGYEDGNTFIGCGSQRNAKHGLLITNSSSLGASPRAPVVVSGCMWSEDGASSAVSSTHYAGIRVEGRNNVTIDNTLTTVGTVDQANGSPVHALSVGVAGGGTVLPSVTWASGVLNYASPSLVSGAQAVYDPSSALPRVLSACYAAAGYQFGTATVPLVAWPTQAWNQIATGVGYQNGWTDSGFSDPGQWRFIADTSTIEVIADLSVPTFSSDSTIFTLPTKYGPNVVQWFPVAIKTSTGSAQVTTPNIQVGTGGVVKAIFSSIPGASSGLTTRLFFHIFISLDF